MNTGNQKIPWEFLASHAVVSVPIIRDGLNWTYLGPEAAVRFGEHLLLGGDNREDVFELASLSRNARLADVLEILDRFDTTSASTNQIWAKVAALWIYSKRDEPDAFAQFSYVCADFKYPEKLSEIWFRYASATPEFWDEVNTVLASDEVLEVFLMPDD